MITIKLEVLQRLGDVLGGGERGGLVFREAAVLPENRKALAQLVTTTYGEGHVRNGLSPGNPLRLGEEERETLGQIVLYLGD